MSATWTKTAGGVWIAGPTPTTANLVFLSTDAAGTGAQYKLASVVQPALPAPGAWHTVNIASLIAGVTAAALAVAVRGYLIITNGQQTEEADLTVAFQKTGAGTNPANYSSQTIAGNGSAGNGLGSRTTYGEFTVPVVDNQFDFAWGRGDSYKGEYPAGAILQYPQGADYEITIDIAKVYTTD